MINHDDYTIIDLVAKDDFFTVVRVERNQDKMKLILKTCTSEQPSLAEIASLQHEYQILSELNISGIVRAHDLIKHDNNLILALEDIDGISLRDYLKQKKLTLANFFQIALDLVDIISALHLRHIVHKNINPDTIFINPVDLSIKLFDFSISSEILEEPNTSMHLHRLEGAPCYISPEQTGRLNRPIDYRSDFYSLGMTFYEMLTGSLPFHAGEFREIIHNHLEMSPTPIYLVNAEIPQQIAAIISKLLAKLPEDRYLSSAGIKADILQCQIEWKHSSRIRPFSLGQHDVYDYLTLSKKLYGRDAQIKQLLETFSQVSAGDTQLLLVSGYSGIGKTSLIKELYAPITQNHGIFIEGKYDQLNRSTPYSAIIQAFRGLIHRLLADQDADLGSLRLSWIAALGNNGQIIVDVIPEISFIIGPQPPVAMLPPAEAQNRFMLTLQNFIHAIAKREHPLVLFLDDLQWIDIASLQLINSLLSDYDLRYFLLIGAYRDNEVPADHPLSLSLNNFYKIGIPVNKLGLTSLTSSDIELFLKDSFNCDISHVQSLAVLILEKTNGNPFFINQFLKVLYQKKLLAFYQDKRAWQWDLTNAEINEITANIISLLTFRIHQLPENTQSLLKLAACIGHTFDLKSLASINEQSVPETMNTLADAISLNLIVPIDGGYKAAAYVNTSNLLTNYNPLLRYQFIHDNVQNAAYTLIEDEMKQQVHLRIGRMLLKHIILQENDDSLFDIVHHFMQSLSLITDSSEKQKVAQYCLWAGKKSKSSSAYQAAKSYLQAGASLLEPIASKNHCDLAFTIGKELAISEYLTGQFDTAEKSFHDLIDCAKNLTDKLDCYKLYCEMLATMNRHEDAIMHGCIALKLAGINLPSKPNLAHILHSILKIKLQLRFRRMRDMELLPVKNSEHRATIDLISQMFNSAFIINQNLFLLLTSTNVNLSLRYGYADSTGFACVAYAFIMMHALNRYNEGIDFVEFYNKLSQIHLTPAFAGKNHFVLGSFIYPYRYPIATSLEMITQAYQYSYESGDLAYSNYCNILLIIIAQMAGDSLPTVDKYIKTALSFIDKIKTIDFKTLAYFHHYSMQCLIQTYLDKSHIEKCELAIIENKNITEKSFFYSCTTKLYYLFGHYELAMESGKKHLDIESYALGMVSVLIGSFYYALAISAEAETMQYLSRQQHKDFKKIIKRIERWTKWCPVNFKHYLLLISAENARLHEKYDHAARLYQEAIDTAANLNCLEIQAVAHERASHFYLSIDSEKLAQLHLQNAYDCYKKWGAFRLCKILLSRHPQLIQPNVTVYTHEETC